jgi:hypothetical protein
MIDARTSTVICRLRDWHRAGGRFIGLKLALTGFIVFVAGVLLGFLEDFIDDHVHIQGVQFGTYILNYLSCGMAVCGFLIMIYGTLCHWWIMASKVTTFAKTMTKPSSSKDASTPEQ